MKTRKFCPRCGRPLMKSDLSKTENAYKFQCFGCDQDFWGFEVFNTREIKAVRQKRKEAYLWEIKNGYKPIHGFKKPYPRPEPTKHQRVNNHGRNSKRNNHGRSKNTL